MIGESSLISVHVKLPNILISIGLELFTKCIILEVEIKGKCCRTSDISDPVFFIDDYQIRKADAMGS
jgi:hypothetical protein